MSSKREVMAAGENAVLARQLGSDQQLAVTAAGSSQATATVCKGEFIEVGTAGSSTGIQLPAEGSVYVVSNGGANALAVFPPVGSYMNGTQNASFSVTNAKTGIFFRSENRYIGILSA